MSMNQELFKEAKRWLKQAKSDFEFLNIASNSKKYDIVCFFSQQVAEKVLKAYLYFQGEEVIFTHSIFKLCEMASNYDKEFTKLKENIKNLDYYYVEARYPNALEDVIPAEFFNEEDAKESIKMAEQTLRFIEERIKLNET